MELTKYYDTHKASNSGDINNESEAQDSTQSESQVQGYRLVRDSGKRPTRPQKRYGYIDLIIYALKLHMRLMMRNQRPSMMQSRASSEHNGKEL